MRFASELVDASDYTFPSAENVRPQELSMAEQLIANLAEPFKAEKYTDDYRANLMKVIRAKMKGKKIEVEEPDDRGDDRQVLDLMSRLQASLEQGKQRSGRAKKKPAAGADAQAEPATPARRKSTRARRRTA
jgi:DNA end-binding protein Ku